MESVASSASSKRARAPANIAQVAHCLVDGCNADLSQCREYHRRHKVCEMHSKTAKVTIGGREQRFCQQCSRFHSLIEFDEGKRSCRKRLDGHNRRRRKPQPESLTRNPGLVFSSQQGTKLLSFGNRETFTGAVVSSSWAGVVNADNDMMIYGNQPDLNYIIRQNSFTEASAHSYKGGSQFQFLQGTERALQGTSTHQPLLDPNPASANSNCSQKKFSDGFLNQVVDSDRALSLLSSAPAVTREIGLSHMVQPDSMHHSQSFTHNLHFGSLGQYPLSPETQSKPVVSVRDSQVSNNSNHHFQEMFQNGPDGSSTSGSQQTLTFMWE